MTTQHLATAPAAPAAPRPVPAAARRALVAARRRGRLGTLTAASVLGAVTFAVFCYSLTVGSFPIPLPDVLRSLLGHGTPGTDFIVLDVRLPRALTAVASGAAFGLSGAIFQNLVRNPLASPDVIGITSGASAAAVVAIVLFGLGGAAVSLSALVGALATAVAIYLLAWRRGVTGYRLVLVGIGVSAALSGMVSFLMTRAEVYTAQQAMVWLTGSLGASDWQRARTLLLCLVPLLPAAVIAARSLPALSLGDDTARGLGVRVERGRLGLVLVGVCLAAVATAATGPVAFVAFLSGPIARRLIHGRGPALALSAQVGALTMLGCDFAGQHLLGPTEFPVGVITGALGAPCLLWLLARSNRVGRGG
ncbi:FecCD family ABC transporter permease [Peterkaempfera bronchialis]|uniref:Iron ABC transporter permease n=1 Tax=Peterkaempfera bronchialis TaxID=2126346 RepID=A0A345T2Y2_9ACTN|nr:iron chelate uptake ABC transporter family permease subunit [Peterkaempfera bronchialis]AXI80337.1 iron ABC transporter permease [Peterkaempfera bronchialis]